MRREQLDGRVEPAGGLREPEVEVVVVDEAAEAQRAVESPDEEARPDVCADVDVVGVEVPAEEEDAVAWETGSVAVVQERWEEGTYRTVRKCVK